MSLEGMEGTPITASLQEHFVIDAQGKKTGVILLPKRYQKLMEDRHDLAVVAERRSEASIPLAEVKQRLRKDGIL